MRDNLDKQVYNLVIQLAEQGFNAERFDRIRDFTKTVAIIPVSAKTGEGIAEVLAILAGLTQNYMKNKLKFAEGPAKGVILEVKELQGLGYTADVVIYEGILRKNDIIVLAGIDGPIVTKVRAILVPRPLQDIKLAKSDLAQIDEVYAASGVKVYAQNLETALAGSPIYVAENNEEVEKYKKIIQEEVSAVRYYNSSVYGIIVKADSLGSLEAIVSSLERRNIPIRLADIGPISKRDITEAEIVAEKAKEYGIIAAFRVKPLSGIEIPEKIKLISDDIIYQLMDNIEKYIEDIKESEKRKTLETIVLPGKIKIIPGYVFRRSDPVIVGVEVLGGIIRPKYGLIKKDGRRVGEVLQIQDNKKSVDRASKGMEVAVSIKGNIMVGRQVEEGEVLYTDVPKEDLQILMEKYKDIVTDDMIEVIKEIIRIKRTQDATYGLGLQFQ